MKSLDSLLTQFGTRVRQLRQHKGLSQEDLAALCNLDRTYVSSIERGKRNVGLKNIYAIALALGVTLSQLMEGVSDYDNP